MPKPFKPINTGPMGPQVFNESADRTMKYYMVAEIELKGLTRADTITTIGFSTGTSAAWFAIDSLREYQANVPSALPWGLAAGVMALVFLALGIVGLIHRRGIMQEIRQGRTP